ncbi:hypothetical protein OG599_12100 [Streptomyces sp. NBC_01335]|uniref:hypothetical protein n=1 Tax=Streptomyces sp. NBC_01335 TaxID=2903828 RepID=UPI002E0E3881|nr:hypothetical protein OG599_12100 [Streptomyces sp. NBC_01335]
MDNSDDSAPEGDDFRLVDQYDSLEDPELKSELLDALGITRANVDAQRRRREAARKTAKSAERTDESAAAAPTVGHDHPRSGGRSRLRAARRKALRGGSGSHPRNRSDLTRRVRSRRSRHIVVVLVLLFPRD